MSGYGLKCKKGSCTNTGSEQGCKDKLENFEEMECKEGYVCYKEHDGPDDSDGI